MTTVRFLHTADWQLGLRRHYLKAEALPRYVQARIDAVRTLADLAREQECEFAVVAGDVFESNHVDRTTLGRALDALEAFPCPVFLLPANHDPHDAASVYRAPRFGSHPRARVLASAEPVAVRPGVEVVGAPWASKRPGADLVADLCGSLAPFDGVRVGVAHGVVDTLALGGSDPARIVLAEVEAALADGRLHYLALGDRHSTTKVTPRVWYSGTPEPTAFDEADPGCALVVDLGPGRCDVRKHRVAQWRFETVEAALDGAADVDALAARLDALPYKDRTVLRLGLKGALGLKDKARLDTRLDEARDLFAALESWARGSDVVVLPDDLSDLDLAGFARGAADDLAALAAGTGERSAAARDALALLFRLAGGVA